MGKCNVKFKRPEVFNQPTWTKVYDFDNTRPLGLTLDDTSGKVTKVDDGGQAADLGIKNGWIVYEVGWSRYSQSVFQKELNNKNNRRIRICFNTFAPVVDTHRNVYAQSNAQNTYTPEPAMNAPPAYTDPSAPPSYDNSVGSGPPAYTSQPPVAPVMVPAYTPPEAPPAQNNNWAEDLRKLKELRDQGVLTEEEFSQSKAKIMQRM